MKTIKLEFHCHSHASKDCLTNPDDLIAECRRKGIDKVVITDHNTIAGAVAAQKIAPDLVIVGEEIRTTVGELLCAFVQEEIPAGLEPQEAIRRLKGQGAFISVSHPFDPSRSPWFERGLNEIRDEVDAIEVFNSRSFSSKINAHAEEYAQNWQLSGTVGSDAHTLAEIGRSSMTLPDFVSAKELRVSLKEAQFETKRSGLEVRLASRYAAMRKRFSR